MHGSLGDKLLMSLTVIACLIGLGMFTCVGTVIAAGFISLFFG